MSLPKDLACRLEYYHDDNPKKPRAWQHFQENWSDRDPIAEGYKTVVIDSLSFLTLRAFHDAKFRTHKFSKEPRKWYGTTTEGLEQAIMGRFSSLRCNVVLTAHISREKDERTGSMIYWPSAPGRLGPKGGGLPSAFAETYRAYVYTSKKTGQNEFRLQTEKSSKFNACTQIMAPDDCEPDYENLWENWDGERCPLHVLVYGDAGSKKSILAATFPQPMIVAMCDPYGKDFPYRRMGTPQGIKKNSDLGIFTQNILR